jgi:ubiquinone/menaquinone biosynthesis C-methylase UbiE
MSERDSFANLSYKRQTYALLQAQAGNRLLDVGCGAGDDLRALAEIVGTDGSVVGVDNSETMVVESRKRLSAEGLPVEVHVGDAQSLQFPESSFDGCRADRVFVTLSDRTAALAELTRVVRGGGRVVVSDPDFDTLVLDASDKVLTRKVVHHISDAVPNGWGGRQLRRLYVDSDLTDIEVVPITAVLTDFTVANSLFGFEEVVRSLVETGDVASDDANSWLAQLERDSECGKFFCAVMGFAVVGQKP